MGWQTSVFTLLIVEAGQPGTGLFVYNGAPGPGNPPIFWPRARPPTRSAHPAGNGGGAGQRDLRCRHGANTQLQLASPAGRSPPVPAQLGIVRNGLLESAILSGFAQVLLNGPGAVAAGHTDSSAPSTTAATARTRRTGR